ncbi:MAG: hypothetical protein EOO21_04865 [Comamonadaceae bacterium]|nr:MAG: hypothetical protein EOO21_04865 [Comamonadaceae bacterium]
MNDNDKPLGPSEAAGDGQARHGDRTEVNWDGGKGRQPYANQGAEEQVPATATDVEGGDRGAASGRNLEQLEAMRQIPEQTITESPRKA